MQVIRHFGDFFLQGLSLPQTRNRPELCGNSHNLNVRGDPLKSQTPRLSCLIQKLEKEKTLYDPVTHGSTPSDIFPALGLMVHKVPFAEGALGMKFHGEGRNTDFLTFLLHSKEYNNT